MAHPEAGLQGQGDWDAWPFDSDKRPHASFNGMPRQPASAPALEQTTNDIAFQLTGAGFDSNTGVAQDHDGTVDAGPQTLTGFNDEDGARFIGSHQLPLQHVRPRPQPSGALDSTLNIHAPGTAPWFPGARFGQDAATGPSYSVPNSSQRHSTYDTDGFAPHNIGVAQSLQVPSHHSQSDRLSTVETTSQISAAYTGTNDVTDALMQGDFFGMQVLTIGELSVCSICRREFTGKYGRGNCSRHIRNTHIEKPATPDPKLLCRKCGKRFKRQDATRKHEKRKHGLHSSASRRRSNARSTSHQIHDDHSEHGTSVYSESLYEPSHGIEPSVRGLQQPQVQIPDRTRPNASYRRSSQQSTHTGNHAMSTPAQHPRPRQRSLQPLQPPIVGAADFELPPNQSFPTTNMAHVPASDPGTHLSAQDMFSNGFSPYMTSSHTSYTPTNYLAANQNMSGYVANYTQGLEPPSPYDLDANWSPTFDNRKDGPYPQQLPPFTDFEYEAEAGLPHSPSQYFPPGSQAH